MSHPHPRIPMEYKATIRTHNGWWFRYTVHRLYGIGIPENGISHHRTLKGARRAAARWCAQTHETIVEEVRGGYRVARAPRSPSAPPVAPTDAATSACVRSNPIRGGGSSFGGRHHDRRSQKPPPRLPLSSRTDYEKPADYEYDRAGLWQ